MRRFLLGVDALINLALGVALLFFSPALVRALGVPPAETGFYPSLLGAVLVGIGIALGVNLRRGAGGGGARGGPGVAGAVGTPGVTGVNPPGGPGVAEPPGGLGLAGAVAINLCGGLALIGWLLWGGLELPLRGQVFLWGLSVVLVGISSVELAAARVALVAEREARIGRCDRERGSARPQDST